MVLNWIMLAGSSRSCSVTLLTWLLPTYGNNRRKTPHSYQGAIEAWLPASFSPGFLILAMKKSPGYPADCLNT